MIVVIDTYSSYTINERNQNTLIPVNLYLINIQYYSFLCFFMIDQNKNKNKNKKKKKNKNKNKNKNKSNERNRESVPEHREQS